MLSKPAKDATMDELIETLFPKDLNKGLGLPNVTVIDMFDSVRSETPDADSKQFQIPKFVDVPKDKVRFYEMPEVPLQLEMFRDNMLFGGDDDFETFKQNLFNQDYDKLKINVDDYLEPKFGGKKMSIKEMLERVEDSSYEELKGDSRDLFFKMIKDRTKHNIGIAALFQEEMNDRRVGL